MLRSPAHPDHPSRAVGLCAFLVGIGMLAAVFIVAYQLFTHPIPGLGLSNPPHGTPPAAADIGVSLANFGGRLLLLALLTLVGSLVASRGVHLCFAAHGPGQDAAHGPGQDAAHGPGQDAAHGPGQDAAHGPGQDAAHGPANAAKNGLAAPDAVQEMPPEEPLRR